MTLNKHLILVAAIILYAVQFISLYAVLDIAVMIPSIALAGLFGWLYCPWWGTLSIIPLTLANLALLHVVSAPLHEGITAFNPVGIILTMISGAITGFLKESSDKLDRIRSELTEIFDEATGELAIRTRKLIENDEQERIQIGQDLHDGVGQYLTGMLLHCEALGVSLEKDGRAEAALAKNMIGHIENSIQTVRQLARSLLPIPFPDTTMESALRGMVTYFNDYTASKISLLCQGSCSAIPTAKAQHLYRIFHEALYRSICKYKATDLDIRLITTKHSCRSIVRGTSPLVKLHTYPNLVSEIMKYRIGAIGSRHSFSTSAKGGFRLECSFDLSEAG